MNKRIFELADEAGFLTENGNVYADSFEAINKGLEVFAELIVQECVKSLRKAFPQMTPNEIANMLLKVK